MTEPNPYVALMLSFLPCSEAEAFAKFEAHVAVDEGSNRVWNCFEPALREPQMRRYLAQARLHEGPPTPPVLSKTAIRKKCWHEGAAARQRAEPETLCPYDLDTWEALYWRIGWENNAPGGQGAPEHMRQSWKARNRIKREK